MSKVQRGCGGVGGGNNEGGFPNSYLNALMFTPEMRPESDQLAAAVAVAEDEYGKANVPPLKPPP